MVDNEMDYNKKHKWQWWADRLSKGDRKENSSSIKKRIRREEQEDLDRDIQDLEMIGFHNGKRI